MYAPMSSTEHQAVVDAIPQLERDLERLRARGPSWAGNPAEQKFWSGITYAEDVARRERALHRLHELAQRRV